MSLKKKGRKLTALSKADLLCLFFYDRSRPTYTVCEEQEEIIKPSPLPPPPPSTILKNIYYEYTSPAIESSTLPPQDKLEEGMTDSDLSDFTLTDETASVEGSDCKTSTEDADAVQGDDISCMDSYEWDEYLDMEDDYYEDEEPLSSMDLKCFELADDWEFTSRQKLQRGILRQRTSRAMKKEKINPDRCVNYARYQKIETRKQINAPQKSSPSTPAFSNRSSSTYRQDESADIQRAISLSLTTNNPPRAAPGVLACGLTQRQLNELMNRELTPEDYELLLLLDDSVAKKTVDKGSMDKFAVRAVTQQDVVESACTISSFLKFRSPPPPPRIIFDFLSHMLKRVRYRRNC